MSIPEETAALNKRAEVETASVYKVLEPLLSVGVRHTVRLLLENLYRRGYFEGKLAGIEVAGKALGEVIIAKNATEKAKE